jgi:hypothetical protein
MIFMRGKRGLVIAHLGKWIIALGVLGLMIAIFLILKDKGIGAIEYIKDLFGGR